MKYFYVLIAGVLLGIILTEKACQIVSRGTKGKTVFVKGKAYEVIKTDIDTQYVTKTTVVEGKSVTKDTTIYVEVPQIVDTASILREFYAKNVLIDTITLVDSLGYVYIRDTISQNQLQFRSLRADVRERTINKEVFLREIPRSRLFIGADITQGKNVQGSLLLVRPKAGAFRVSYGTQGMGVGYYLKLR